MEQLNEKIKGLVKKAEKSGMPYSILKKVYDRGMAAWKTGHRPGTTPQQWAFARVNSFVTKSSGTWGKADKDLADKVRGAKKESIENPKKAKVLIGQVREKLGKDADAGDYIKDFRKSKAPQFKGKSDKKIQKMAIAAYLDSKEEIDLDERLKFKYALIDTSKNNEVIALSSDDKELESRVHYKNRGRSKVVKLKRPVANDKMIGYPLKEENLQEMEVKYIHTKDPQGFMNTYQGTSASKGLSMLSKDSPRRGEYLINGDKKNHDVFQKMLKNIIPLHLICSI